MNEKLSAIEATLSQRAELKLLKTVGDFPLGEQSFYGKSLSDVLISKKELADLPDEFSLADFLTHARQKMISHFRELAMREEIDALVDALDQLGLVKGSQPAPIEPTPPETTVQAG